jgi:hypothetical protein
MLASSIPRTQVLQIVEKAAPRETGTDRIERVLAELTAQRGKKNDPTTH